MSKQSEAKERQGYDPNPVPATCSNCRYFTFEMREYEGWDRKMYTEQRKLRCALGGFAVKKRACCKQHEMAQETQK